MSAHALRLDAESLPASHDTCRPSPQDGAQSQINIDRNAWVDRGREVIRHEAAALETLSETLGADFQEVVATLVNCSGKVIVSGIGKAGLIGQKFSATLSSTGTPSHFLHPAEAVHGDMGGVQARDVVIFFSYSGETEEVNRLLGMLRSKPAFAGNTDGSSGPISIAITKRVGSTLASQCDQVLPLGDHREACALGLAPSTSTTLMLAISDAIALVVSEVRGFTAEQFAGFHPGGSLGRKLSRVTDVMRPLDECRVAFEGKTVREVLVDISRPGRRTGAIMLVDEKQTLSGIFTDSDLARLLERQQDVSLDRPVAEVMSRKFHTIDDTQWLSTAVERMSKYKISELPVVDADGRPKGLMDITDVVDLVKPENTEFGTKANATMSSGVRVKSSTGVQASNTEADAPSPGSESTERGYAPSSGPSSAECGLPRILSLIKYRKEAE